MSLPAHATQDLVTLGYLQQTPVQDDDWTLRQRRCTNCKSTDPVTKATEPKDPTCYIRIVPSQFRVVHQSRTGCRTEQLSDNLGKMTTLL